MRLTASLLTTALSIGILSAPASAQRLSKHSTVVWVGLNGNDAQLTTPITSSTVPFESGEAGLHVAYSYFVTDVWTGVISGGFDAGGTRLKVGAAPTRKLTSSSWNMRVGFDRYAFINDDVALYAGPGFVYWRGNGKLEGSGSASTDREWPTVRQLAFNGRLGMYARFSGRLALFGHVGQVIGRNFSEEGDNQVSWWSNHHEGSVGLAVDI